MANDPLKDLINGVGIMCEMAGLFRDHLLRNGFTREEAVVMSSEVIKTMLTQAANGNTKGE